MEPPLISVVIPSYNSANFIADTLETVFNQTYSNYEVIVSDDGSNDDTVEIVKKFFGKFPEKRTRLLSNEHKGPGANRNEGIKSAVGDWISFLDSDDRWFRDKLKRVASYIVEHDGVGLVCHSEIWKRGENQTELNYQKMFDENISPFLSLYRRNALSTSAVTVRRDLLMKTELFDPALPAAQDYDLWLRLSLLEGMKIEFIECPLGLYITREGNISSKPEKRLRCLLQISDKTYNDLIRAARFPYIEKIRFEGRAYGAAGLEMVALGNVKKGLYLIIISIIKWPFRFDWMCKLFKH
ncbi:MAG: glycosyltransferase family 2 protein [Candidatus Anammoxibacter sp.]